MAIGRSRRVGSEYAHPPPPPLRPFFLNVHAVYGKNMPDSRLQPTPCLSGCPSPVWDTLDLPLVTNFFSFFIPLLHWGRAIVKLFDLSSGSSGWVREIKKHGFYEAAFGEAPFVIFIPQTPVPELRLQTACLLDIWTRIIRFLKYTIEKICTFACRYHNSVFAWRSTCC